MNLAKSAADSNVNLDLPVIDVRGAEQSVSATIKGHQTKWYLPETRLFVKRRFFNEGRAYRDYVVEALASGLSNSLNFNSIEQTMCTIETPDGSFQGSYSESFLAPGEQFITFSRLYRTLNDLEYPQKWTTVEVEDRIRLTVAAFQEKCGIDVSDYLFQMITLDLLVGNEDRHWNNFGIVYNGRIREYRIAPLFDFGLGLFEHDSIYDGKSLVDSIIAMRNKPYGLNQYQAYQIACKLFGRDMEGYVIDISDRMFPSAKGLNYFTTVCAMMGIEILGDGVIL